jgi:hypothetical protein
LVDVIHADWIKEKARENEFQLSGHAHKERQEEIIHTGEIREALINCEILENYPKDPKGPSCLVLGYAMGRPVHVVCGRAKNDWLLIITVYIPKPPKWIDPKTRGGHEK